MTLALHRLILVVAMSLLVVTRGARALRNACSPRPLAPERSSQLVVFALLRGGAQRGQYDSFVSSRKCSRGVLSPTMPHDDVAFHESSVPKLVQDDLQAAE
eukprot:3732739-Prymnesium_polylepis.2